MTNYTNDPLSACCGDPGDCSRAHLYCFNRTPKEADVDAMNTFEATFDKTRQAAQAAINGATHGSTVDVAEASAALARIAEQVAAMPAAAAKAIALPQWALDRLAAAEKKLEQEELHLPRDSKARKETPICTGVLDYFPKALAEVARLSKAGNDKHNPGQPLHWDREKSTDHADCIIRHMMERGTVDEFGFLHEVSVAWRALAQLEVAIERERGK